VTAISVIVCAYTEARWDALRAAVDSLAHQTLEPEEVVLVVDHNPALLERIRRELPGVRAEANRSRRGLSGARNTGVTVASRPIVAFLDDDALPARDWLASLVAPYDDLEVIGTGGRCEPDWLAGRPRWFPEEFDWVVGCTYRGLPEHSSEVRNPIGASMSFRRTALELAGAFREDMGRVGRIPLGCEETELAIRMRRMLPSCRIMYVPQATVSHTVPAERARFRYFLARCHAEGLSKALVTGVAGAGRGLASERAYAYEILPRGAVAGLRDAVHGDAAGIARTVVIVIGLAAATSGYVHGTIRGRRGLS
jgi:GT2 family glycosyltransferase